MLKNFRSLIRNKESYRIQFISSFAHFPNKVTYNAFLRIFTCRGKCCVTSSKCTKTTFQLQNKIPVPIDLFIAQIQS